MGNRMSSLPVARYCPKSPRLGEQYGAGRPAIMGSAFHAMASDPRSEETATLFMQLTDDEAQTVMTWHKPADVDLGEHTLKYSEAIKEFEVALNSQCGYCLSTDPDCMTVGHVDMAWIVETDFERIAYVPDMKKSEWTVKTAPEKSLQILAYGIATALKFGCDGFVPGIWACTEGTWDWGDIIHLDSDECRAACKLIVHSATNEGEAVMGAHCNDDCYGRLHCSDWLLPGLLAMHGPSGLAGMCEGSAGEMTNAEALELVLLSKRTEDALKVIKENIKAFARRHPIVDEASSKRYAANEMRGRLSLDRAALEEDYPGLFDRYQKRGRPSVQVRWKNL